jgi:hypothetical protein
MSKIMRQEFSIITGVYTTKMSHQKWMVGKQDGKM